MLEFKPLLKDPDSYRKLLNWIVKYRLQVQSAAYEAGYLAGLKESGK